MLSIIVDARACDALMRAAGKKLVAYAALVRAERIVGLTTTSPPLFVVRCDDSDARSLLATAEQHCPAAVHDIRLAIDEARKTGRTSGP